MFVLCDKHIEFAQRLGDPTRMKFLKYHIFNYKERWHRAIATKYKIRYFEIFRRNLSVINYFGTVCEKIIRIIEFFCSVVTPTAYLDSASMVLIGCFTKMLLTQCLTMTIVCKSFVLKRSDLLRIYGDKPTLTAHHSNQDTLVRN